MVAPAPRAAAGRGTVLYWLAGAAGVVLVGLMALLGRATVQEAPLMRVGLVATPESEPIALARACGALDPRRVSVVEFCSFEDLRNAFLDGNVHAGVFTLDDALRLARPPVNARIERFVALGPAPLRLVTAPRGPALAGLRGRHVGMESGRRDAYALQRMLAGAGLTLHDVVLDRVDSDSGDEALGRGFVDAVVSDATASERLAGAGGRVLGEWMSEPPGEMLVLLATARAHRLAAGQIEHLGRAWTVGAERAQRPDSSDLGLLARREDSTPGRIAAALGAIRYLSPEEDRRLRAGEDRATLAPCLAAIGRRWRALGVTDSLPDPLAGVAP